jgi:hypothetical protein
LFEKLFRKNCTIITKDPSEVVLKFSKILNPQSHLWNILLISFLNFKLDHSRSHRLKRHFFFISCVLKWLSQFNELLWIQIKDRKTKLRTLIL